MKETTKDAITWFCSGLLIMAICSLTLFDRVKKSVIRDCLNSNVLMINGVNIQCKVDITKFDGEVITEPKKIATLVSDNIVNDSTTIKPKSITITIDGQ